MASEIFVIERELVKSEAFRKLPSTAIILLMDFLMRRRMKKGNILNNGDIVYPFSEAQRKGIPPATFNCNRDILVERGFLDVTHAGSGGKKGDLTRYALSDRWRKWGKENFKAASRPKDLRKGVGFAVYHRKKNIAITGDT